MLLLPVTCQHMFSVILSYLEAVQSARPVSEADPEDECISLAPKARKEGDDILAGTVEEDLWQLRNYLGGMVKKELVDLLLEGRDQIPKISRQLLDQEELA